MKQTAVEFLISKLNPYGLSESQTLVFEQAKEMEKQQIIDAFKSGDCNGTFETINGEQYYSEKFKQD